MTQPIANNDAVLVAAVTVTGGVGAAGAAASDHTAPILAFVGALIVAVITAITTNRRQTVQLAAERARLELQLAHERHLADLADLRVVLEEALASVEHATRRLNEMGTRGPRKAERRELESRVAEVSDAADRLRLRLVSGDELLTTYLSLVDAVRLTIEANLKGNDLDVDRYVAAYHQFVRAAVIRVGSVTDRV